MKKIKPMLWIGALMLLHTVSAQTERELIDQQIWVPFTKSWESNDGEAFNAIHSDDMMRITSKEIVHSKEYKSRNLKRMANPKEVKQTISFAFDYRQVNGNTAYEMGFYKIVSHREGIDPYYARFHVELRKENGVWKIYRDYDSDKIGLQRVNPKMYAALEFKHFE